jgi:hypothetical protein
MPHRLGTGAIGGLIAGAPWTAKALGREHQQLLPAVRLQLINGAVAASACCSRRPTKAARNMTAAA